MSLALCFSAKRVHFYPRYKSIYYHKSDRLVYCFLRLSTPEALSKLLPKLLCRSVVYIHVNKSLIPLVSRQHMAIGKLPKLSAVTDIWRISFPFSSWLPYYPRALLTFYQNIIVPAIRSSALAAYACFRDPLVEARPNIPAFSFVPSGKYHKTDGR